MKIAIIGTRGIPNQYGGFEQFAQWLSEGLAEKGHEIYVYCSSRHSYQEKNWRGVHLVHCHDPEERLGTAGQFLYDRNCIRDARKRNFDAWLHLGYTSDSIWCRLWPKNIPHLVNMDGLEWKRDKYNRLTKEFLKYAEKLAALNATKLIADSPVIQQYLQQQYQREASYIPYGARVFEQPAPALVENLGLNPFSYYLVVARMEPENNIETIIRGWQSSRQQFPLVITGNDSNRYGIRLKKKYQNENIRFTGPIYDGVLLDNLRYHSSVYVHGHSVGGTNPSLLEAMACQCSILAHDNNFNKAVLEEHASYFSSAKDITMFFDQPLPEEEEKRKKIANIEKIRSIYTYQRITDAYEALMLEATVVVRR